MSALQNYSQRVTKPSSCCLVLCTGFRIKG